MSVNVTPDSFRANFPEFADADVYSDARVAFWLNFAVKRTESHRWDESGFRDEAVQFLTAHYLTVEVQAAAAGDGGASLAAGVKTSESQSAGGVSYSDGYDGSAYTGEGQLSTTLYGRNFLDLAALVGMGGVQL
ncbi:MAG: DUF4054 domain-containing protein [Pyramidobacter sp.]|nr:DUF4054 domain-containing protein [Pyramidobacter sp.]MBQ8130581.1 DUF4054 domain-containing protein [Clostridia bacterium]